MSKGDLKEALDNLEKLRTLHEQVIGQIDEARRGLVTKALDDLGRFTPPPEGAQDDEAKLLGGLAQAVNAAIAQERVRDLAGLVGALAEAHASVLKAIDKRLQAALSDLKRDYDKVVVPEGALEEELVPSLEHRRDVEQALLDRQPQRGREALRALVLALRVAAKPARRRAQEQKQRDLSEQDRMAEERLEADRERSRALRVWIVDNLYGPNVELKRRTGFLQPMAPVDEMYELDALTEVEYGQRLEALQTTWLPQMQKAQERARQVDETRPALGKRVEIVDRQIEQCQSKDIVKVPKLPPGWAVPDLKKYASDDAAQWLKQLQESRLRINEALAQLSHDPSRTVDIPLAEKVLEASRELGAKFAEWRNGLGQWDTDKAGPMTKLLFDCAAEFVDKGLRLALVQGRYNAAREQRLPLRALRAQLETDWAEQRKITDPLKVLGLKTFSQLPAYESIPVHMTYFPDVYKGGALWPASDEENTAKFRASLLTALVSKGRQSVHATLEWTGENNHIENLKCYRDVGDVDWNSNARSYNDVAGKLATAKSVGSYYPQAHKLGAIQYPSVENARAHLKQVIQDKVTAMEKRLEEMCKYRGLTQEEKTANVSTSLKP